MSHVTTRLLALSVTLAVLAMPGISRAQSADQFARAYAPMYWFAIDDPIYPTLPHPFAFDGVPQRIGETPCRLDRDQGGASDFSNPKELNLDLSCDRVALKRRFRPLLQGASQGVDEGSALHPRMRILFDGPRYFSGGLDITNYKSSVCRQESGRVEDATGLIEYLQRFHTFDDPGPHRVSAGSGKAPFRGLPPDRESRLCKGSLTDQDLGLERPAETHGRTFRIRPVWEDKCRNVPVWSRPRKADCVGDAKLMAFSGNDALDNEQGAILKPRYLIQYWAYFLYDRGINGHLHDGEHVFVFIEGSHYAPPTLNAPVVAIVGGGHEEDAANNILLAGSINTTAKVLDQIDFPERLPRHPMVLVELGKHASAPDRNLNGRFDIGVDGNLWGENAWGSRDTQSALFGKAQLGKMQPWYSMPRSSDGIYAEETAWSGLVFDKREYGSGYPHGVFTEFVARINPSIPAASSEASTLCDFGSDRRYRLMPIPLLRDLSKVIKESKSGWEEVRSFLNTHRAAFWENGCFPGLPDSSNPQINKQIETALLDWSVENEKRDVWVHRKFKNPDSVFKTHLFPRITAGWALRAFSGHRQHVAVLQFADIGKARFFHDSLVEISGNKRHVALTIENFRGRYRGWYSGFSSDKDADGPWRGSFRAGYAFQFATLETFPGVGSLLKKIKFMTPLWQRTKAGIRFGGRGLIGSVGSGGLDGNRRFAFEWSFSLALSLRESKHPLKFYPDIGTNKDEERGK